MSTVTKAATGEPVTVIIGQRIKPGCEHEFSEWQHELNAAASTYPGFVGAEINPPGDSQPEWVVVYRFDSIANAQAWINSRTRQERLAVGRDFFDGPGTQQVVRGAAKQPDQLVTVVVTHRVAPDQVDDFLAWQHRLNLAESRFPGFRGAELFRPVAGLQDEWTAMYRYDTAADLDAWLTSNERAALLAEGSPFKDFHLRTIDNSFGSWFAFAEKETGSPPSDFKMSIAVWVGLYPTVVILSLLTYPLNMPLWLGMFVGNLLSSFTMSYVTMPWYVNKVLRGYLAPSPTESRVRNAVRSTPVIATIMLTTLLAVYLFTTRVFPG